MPREVIDWVINVKGDAARKLDKLSTESVSLKQALTVATGALAAAGAAAVAAGAGFKELADHISGAVDNMNTLAEGTGFTIQTVNAMRLAARSAGKELEDFFPRDLPERMVAATEAGSEQSRVFAKLGVQVTDTHGRLRSVEDVFRDLIDALVTHEDRTEASGLAMKLMGDKGQQLFTAFGEGSKTLDYFIQRADYMGIDTSPRAIALTNEWIEANAKLTQAFEIMADAIFHAVGPGVIQWIENAVQNTVFLAQLLKETNMLASDIRDMDLSMDAVGRAAAFALEWRATQANQYRGEFTGPTQSMLVNNQSGGGTGMRRPGASSTPVSTGTQSSSAFMTSLGLVDPGTALVQGVADSGEVTPPVFDAINDSNRKQVQIFEENSQILTQQGAVLFSILSTLENGITGPGFDFTGMFAMALTPMLGPFAGIVAGSLNAAVQAFGSYFSQTREQRRQANDVFAQYVEEYGDGSIRRAMRHNRRAMRSGEGMTLDEFGRQHGLARGTPYVKRDGIKYLHEGERVMTREENQRYTSRGGSSSRGMTVHVHAVKEAREFADRLQRELGAYGLNLSIAPLEG